MSVYYPSFEYLGKNSLNDMDLMVAHVDGGDSGEVETFLSMEPVYTDNYLGTQRIDYGAKYNSVAVLNVTLMKTSGADFSVHDVRECLKWLTGTQSNSDLKLMVDGVEKYKFIGRFTNASQYKLDARTVGLVMEFTSISPWAYTPAKIEHISVNGLEENVSINCDTDDLYTYTNVNVKYTSNAASSLIINNKSLNEITRVDNVSKNEIITLSDNMMITSDNVARKFGSDFNFIFPRLTPGINQFDITGSGIVTFEYITPVKIGNVAIDINAYSEPICDEVGNITVEKLPWSRITDAPTTLSGYGIADAYTKEEIDTRLSSGVLGDTYSKAEIDNMFTSINIDIDENDLQTMLSEVLT